MFSKIHGLGVSPILSIRFSIDKKVIAVQRSDCEIQFFHRETKQILNHKCRAGSESILGFFWSDSPLCDLAIVKTRWGSVSFNFIEGLSVLVMYYFFFLANNSFLLFLVSVAWTCLLVILCWICVWWKPRKWMWIGTSTHMKLDWFFLHQDCNARQLLDFRYYTKFIINYKLNW